MKGVDQEEVRLLEGLEALVRERCRWTQLRDNRHSSGGNTIQDDIEIELLNDRIGDVLNRLDHRRTSLERITIDQLGLSVRTYNALTVRRSFRTAADLVKCSWKDLIRIPTFGQTSLLEVKHALAKHGLALRKEEK